MNMIIIRGAKTTRFVALAVREKMDRLTSTIESTEDENVRSDASNDLGLYKIIFEQMEQYL